MVHGSRGTRRNGKRADYLLCYTRDFAIAVVEAKPENEPAATGLQQAKDYAEILGLKFAYATNGLEIIEFDYITGLERTVPSFPTPAELWSRLRAAEKLTDDTAAQRLLTPANLTTGKEPRYYQQTAINRAVQSILQGRKRVLLTMATGTVGFLVEAYNHLAKQVKTVADRRILQERTLLGCEPKPLPYLLCQMNLLLHGLDAPQIDPGNALRHKLTDIGERDRGSMSSSPTCPSAARKSAASRAISPTTNKPPKPRRSSCNSSCGSCAAGRVLLSTLNHQLSTLPRERR